MTAVLKTPEHAGMRDQAALLVEPLDLDLSGRSVMLDCSDAVVSTPSFLDEIVKQLFVERDASSLRVQGASLRARDLLIRAAENRGYRDRLTFSS